VFAPPGVHLNWPLEELPKHFPKRLLPRTRTLAWDGRRARQVGFKRELEGLLSHSGLSWLFMNYEAVTTEPGARALARFLKRGPALMALDESGAIKTPGAARSKRIRAYGRLAAMRRIMDGTPISNAPLDIYNQVAFLSPDFWRGRGVDSFFAFKQHFAEWETEVIRLPGGKVHEFPRLVKYKNMDELHEVFDTFGERVTKESAGIDLPPKLYQKYHVELSEEQRKVYERVRSQLLVELNSGLVDASSALLKMVRLQQVVSGFLPPRAFMGGDDEQFSEPPSWRAARNPKLEALSEIVSKVARKAIVWARFRCEVDDVCAMLTREGVPHVRYDGSTPKSERPENIRRFQNEPVAAGGPRVFVANPAAAGTGLTLHAADTVVYYSNSFKLTERLQSEDRAHRIGQSLPVTYIDIVALDTVDEKVLDALRRKRDLAATVTRDELRSWL